MLVPMRELLTSAKVKHKVVPAFNVYNLETMQAVAKGAAKTGCPVIFAVGEKYLNSISLTMAATMVKTIATEYKLCYALHLDHAQNEQTVLAALKVGFTSVMFDGSQLSLQENVQKTKMLAVQAHRQGASIEGELGYLNPEDGTGQQLVGEQTHTDPGDAAFFVHQTGVDALAVAVGNAHGIYKSEPKLNLPRIEQIAQFTQTPLVLHGASGIPFEQLQMAATLGVQKININTELALQGAAAVLRLGNTQSPLRLEKAMSAAQNAMEQVVIEFCSALCCINT